MYIHPHRPVGWSCKPKMRLADYRGLCRSIPYTWRPSLPYMAGQVSLEARWLSYRGIPLLSHGLGNSVWAHLRLFLVKALNFIWVVSISISNSYYLSRPPRNMIKNFWIKKREELAHLLLLLGKWISNEFRQIENNPHSPLVMIEICIRPAIIAEANINHVGKHKFPQNTFVYCFTVKCFIMTAIILYSASPETFQGLKKEFPSIWYVQYLPNCSEFLRNGLLVCNNNCLKQTRFIAASLPFSRLLWVWKRNRGK